MTEPSNENWLGNYLWRLLYPRAKSSEQTDNDQGKETAFCLECEAEPCSCDDEPDDPSTIFTSAADATGRRDG